MANRAFCVSCGHDHISGIPSSTWRCRQCGFGSWGKITADEHLKHCPDHQVYETEHRFLDKAALDALIREKQAEALEHEAAQIRGYTLDFSSAFSLLDHIMHLMKRDAGSIREWGLPRG